MPYTISTHNGTKISHDHNIRNRKVTNKESHIDPNGEFEIWYDEPIRKAYERLFSKSVKEYNERMISKGHKERCLKSYFHKIKDDKQKHLAYEMIVMIGSNENHLDDNLSKEILKEFYDQWNVRNPSLHLLSCCYHNDEKFCPGHIHISYIPIADNLKRGMRKQTSLVKALESMGFKTKSIHDTAQIQWERRENAYLEHLCNKRGIEIIHPRIEGRKHLENQIYRMTKQNEILKEQVNKLIDKHNSLVDIIKRLRELSVDLAYDIVEDYQKSKNTHNRSIE